MCDIKGGSSSYQKNKEFLVRLFNHAYSGSWECLVASATSNKTLDDLQTCSPKKSDTLSQSDVKEKKKETRSIESTLLSYRDGRQWNLLHFAAAGSNLEVMRHILMFDPQVANWKDSEEGVTPIMVAARHGHRDACVLLVEFFPECVSTLANDGKSVLHFAVQGRNLDCINFVLKQNINIFHIAESVGSATYWCIATYVEQFLMDSKDPSCDLCFSVLETLFRYQPDTLGAPQGYPPSLCLASVVGDERLVALLLSAGADLLVSDKDGWTPLHLAAEAGHFAVVRRLVEESLVRKVDVLTLENKDSTALELAEAGEHSEIYNFLLSYGCKPTRIRRLLERPTALGHTKDNHQVSPIQNCPDDPLPQANATQQSISSCLENCSESLLCDVERKKLEANEYVKQRKYNLASELYQLAISQCCHCPRFQSTRSILESNLSFCFTQLCRYQDALRSSQKSIVLNPRWFKGHLRASEAYEAMGNLEEAAQALWEAVLCLPDSDPQKNSLRSSFTRLVNCAKKQEREKKRKES